MSENNDPEERDLHTVDIITDASSHHSTQAEDLSYCSGFLSCLTRCLKSRPKSRKQELPKDTVKRKSLVWEKNSDGIVTPAPEIVHGLSKSPCQQQTILLEESNPQTQGSVAEVFADSNKSAEEAINITSAVNPANTTNICPDNIPMNLEPFKQDNYKTTKEKCTSGNRMFKANDDEVCHKTSQEKWWESVEHDKPGQYYEIEANVIADRAVASCSKGITMRIEMDLDEKMYNVPRENVTYSNGLIKITGDAGTSEMPMDV